MTNEEMVFGKNKDSIPRDYYQITNYRDRSIDRVNDPNRRFINGFKAIKVGEEAYGYVRESDNKLMPYYYDNAYDFNKYGFAMVGRQGVMTWINKDFKYLRNDRTSSYYDNYYAMSEDYIHDPYRILYGFHSVGEFSKGDIPLSRIQVSSEGVIYFGTDGVVKTFKRYSDIDKRSELCKFYSGTPFNEKGMAIAEFKGEKLILFAEGYYIGYEEIAKLAIDRGLIDSIWEEAKTLKKVK